MRRITVGHVDREFLDQRAPQVQMKRSMRSA
jgi:hypothetical protein